MESNNKFSIEDIHSCWGGYGISYFLDVLNGEYSLEDARADLRSLIGSKYDSRVEDDELLGGDELIDR